MSFKRGALVEHAEFGKGRVRLDDGESVLVRFEHGLEECLASSLVGIRDLEIRAAEAKYEDRKKVAARVLGACIRSVNESWGVFSRSRINLLPHQLWVCKRVLEKWPARWLVADDVGLGKTIEAGLILSPLVSSGRVRRLLILTPASLVKQWQRRLRELFDIRMTAYSPAVDTEAADYWNTQHMVIASAQTIRMDRQQRWERLLAAEDWDLVMVDEAHHLNAKEDGERTLAFQLLEKMQARGRITSMVFFTGTPHRGKDYAFLSLLQLLRPDEFDPEAPLEGQVGRLRDVMIRNNKASVADMSGRPMFKPVKAHFYDYGYSEEESLFYKNLTDFIEKGKAYVSGHSQRDRRAGMFVLITMQKLASSSVAAVQRALKGRLERLKRAKKKIARHGPELERYRLLKEAGDPSLDDEISSLEEHLAESLGSALRLNPEEIPALEELLSMAHSVREETKISKILEVVEERFAGRSVLFFTEYKATQARLMSALLQRYGDGCVTFINGDGLVREVRGADGTTREVQVTREEASRRFNSGAVRFLVSTEAAGEGVDLQGACSALIHVDLPWNPMRLHQRVGRLSRYGQTEVVDVVTIRNPETVESRIWECLDAKLDRITLAFQGGMDDPEDMRLLVLGMASPRMVSGAFADVPRDLDDDALERWFDAKTAKFGGEDALDLVRSMFGSVARFDFGEVADQIPKVDLPDLVPFMKVLFAAMGRRPSQAGEQLSFRTPDSWCKSDFRIIESYDLLFSRKEDPGPGVEIGGAGLLVVDHAFDVAIGYEESVAAIGDLLHPIVIFAARDRVTATQRTVRKVCLGVEQCGEGSDGGWRILRDWEVIRLLNPIADRPRGKPFSAQPALPAQDVAPLVEAAGRYLADELHKLGLPFDVPAIESLACLVPGVA